MSKEFYRKGKWPINTDHGWKIRAATKATENLFAACSDVTVKIGDVEIDQNFFVQDEVSHSVILSQPFITASCTETKVLDSGAAFARIRSQNGGKSVQFLIVPANHEKNKRELLSQTKMDF
jgi:homoaconitase/3-isopropylmalate dehydratase large subunit